MSNIDFSNSPQVNDRFAAGTNMWRFDGQKWKMVIYTYPKYGIIDGADSDSKVIIVNGGAPTSDFTGLDPIDSGSIA